MPRLWIIVCGLAIISCGSSAPSPPSVDGPTGVETINGSERIGWDQSAADAVELATFGYAIYVDGARTDATNVMCGSSPAAPGFPCSAKLPAMMPGNHTLELTAFVNSGALLESPRSSPVRVNVVAPGWVNTPMTANLPQDVRDRALQETALGRLGEPDDVAQIVWFLASPFAGHVTGQIVRVDGGQLIV